MTLEPSNLQTAPFRGKLRLRLGVISPWRTTPGSQDLWAGRELLMCYWNIIHDYDCYVWLAYSDLGSSVWQLQLSQVLAAKRQRQLCTWISHSELQMLNLPFLLLYMLPLCLMFWSPCLLPPPTTTTTTNHQPPPPSPVANYDAKAHNKTPVISLSQNPRMGISITGRGTWSLSSAQRCMIDKCWLMMPLPASHGQQCMEKAFTLQELTPGTKSTVKSCFSR